MLRSGALIVFPIGPDADERDVLGEFTGLFVCREILARRLKRLQAIVHDERLETWFEEDAVFHRRGFLNGRSGLCGCWSWRLRLG